VYVGRRSWGFGRRRGGSGFGWGNQRGCMLFALTKSKKANVINLDPRTIHRLSPYVERSMALPGL
jgi:hypothetical protein